MFAWLIIPDERVKFRDPLLNCSREIPPEAIEGAIFDSFFVDNCTRPEADQPINQSINQSIRQSLRRSS